MSRDIFDGLELENTDSNPDSYIPGTGSSDFDISPLMKKIEDILDFSNKVVLDPSALPFLPALISNSKNEFRIPTVIYQLLRINRNDIREVWLPDVPEDEQSNYLQNIMELVIRKWVHHRRKINWTEIRESLLSSQCSPTIPNWEVERYAKVNPKYSVDVHIEGIGTDLVSKIVGQEIAGAHIEKLPILGVNHTPLTNLVSNFMNTVVMGGPNKFQDWKQEKVKGILGDWVEESRGWRWFIGVTLEVTSVIVPGMQPLIPLGLTLQILDP